MNILIPDSWLREYLDTNATPKQIQSSLSLCGPSIERMHQENGDSIYDIEVTTNRVDQMGIFGIAREAVAILPQFGYTASAKIPPVHKFVTGDISGLSIKNDPLLCHRILALKVDNVSATASPEWLKEKLLKVGLRPLNALVDITNYVMWETAHPTHVFDFNRLSTGQMVIREAVAGEKIITLDDKEYSLKGGEVVIDDGTGNIIDLPSIMGTSNSVVVPETTSALFFIDDIDATKVRFASMTHQIRTQAATLMEKGVDPNLAIVAMSRIYAYVKQLFPKAKFSSLLDIYPNPQVPAPISLSLSQISNLIGVDLSASLIKNILNRLDFSVKTAGKMITVTPPSYRTRDIQIPEDVVEEVARIYGYHNIPSQLMTGQLPAQASDPIFSWETKIKAALKYFGFTEVYTYSLVAQEKGALKLSNPLSNDWLYLRKSLFPSHQQVISENLGRVPELSLFEIANVYLPQESSLPQEELHLILSTTNPDYYSFKGKIESLLSDINVHEYPIVIENSSGIFYWEVPLLQLIKLASSTKTYVPISPYPPIVEDFNVQSQMPYSDLLSHLYSLSPLVSQVELVDNYQGKLTLRISFHSPEKQLSSNDISSIRTQILKIK